MGKAIFDLATKHFMVKVLTNQNQLIFGFAFPIVIIQGETLAAEVKNVALGAFLEPKDTLSAEYVFGELVVQKVLKFLDVKGAIALNR